MTGTSIYDENSRLREEISTRDDRIVQLGDRIYAQAAAHKCVLEALEYTHKVQRAQLNDTIALLHKEIKSLRETLDSGKVHLLESLKEALSQEQEKIKSTGKRRLEEEPEPDSPPKRQRTEPPESYNPDSDRPIETLVFGRRGPSYRLDSDLESPSAAESRSATTPEVDDAREPAISSQNPNIPEPPVDSNLQDPLALSPVLSERSILGSRKIGSDIVLAYNGSTFDVWIENGTLQTNGDTSTQSWIELEVAWKTQLGVYNNRDSDWPTSSALRKHMGPCLASYLVSRATPKWTREFKGRLCCMTCFNKQRLCVKFNSRKERFELLPLPPPLNSQQDSPGLRTYLYPEINQWRVVDPDSTIW